MQKMTKTKFDIKTSRKRKETTVKEFPELGNIYLCPDRLKKVWGHWLKTGKEWTEREFEERYQRWREIKHKNYRLAMERLGIAALPLMIDKIREGETALIPLVSRLVDRELAEDASRRQCLRWWEENRDKWVITFKDAPIALPTHEELSRQSDVEADVGLALATDCFAKGSCESYSELLRKAVAEASEYRGGFRPLSIRWRGDVRWGGKQVPFRPFVERLAEPNAVPFLVKVIYEGWCWGRELGRYYEHAGRCYSVLSLAVSGDPVAFAVLSDVLENDVNFGDPCILEIIREKYGIRTFVTDPCLGERFTGRYDIRAYAAVGLGILEDSNAVEPLLRMLGDRSSRVKHHCIWALGRIGDVRAIKPMLEAVVHDEQIDGWILDARMQKMTKTKFEFETSRDRKETTVKDFPELGNIGRGSQRCKKVWGHWLKEGKGWTEREFEKRYQRWREIKHKNYYQAMAKLGIAALPLMIDKIREGETALIPLVSWLVDKQLAEDASRRQCLRWWEENRDKWVITFKDAPIALPTHEELSMQSDVEADVGLALATDCFAKDSSEPYSELLRKAVEKAQWLYHGSDFTLLRHIRHAGFEDSKWIKDPPEFIPLVEGLDEPNAVPFLVKVIYEGPNWDKELPGSRLIGYENAGRCYSVLSLAVSGDPVAFAVLSDILENDANFSDPCIPETIKQKYGIRALLPTPILAKGTNGNMIYAPTQPQVLECWEIPTRLNRFFECWATRIAALNTNAYGRWAG
jgi:hypothetical protein